LQRDAGGGSCTLLSSTHVIYDGHWRLVVGVPCPGDSHETGAKRALDSCNGWRLGWRHGLL
jgi:hypothetical protein